MSKSKVAIIPARGGSKRIPKKNIKKFHGKPMIAYSIEVAKASGCFDRIVVSTDDEEIASVAKKYGAEVPFLRPAKISDDFATTLDVIEHAILELDNEESEIGFVCCLYATAPFVTVQDLQEGFRKLSSVETEYVFAATSFPFPIQRAIQLSEKGDVSMFNPENEMVRSQDLIEAYHDAGQFYWGKKSAFLKRKSFFSSGSKAILLPRSRVQDIDTLDDWDFAELLFSLLNKTQ